ncbi:hypothetical protein MANES_07G095824v8 [Manihot esculenta]|uniref:Uncharacterized protein n=2 Tax=Manihot esculenta TaxID=3983 RepID=A0ACB7HH83_MANES|nr:hypothetical protein MANES_07G095824v8 [Manihot esculenta]KAG8651158.1 hypothetical protein MANES_07G095824v8 [Manihot esculenta]
MFLPKPKSSVLKQLFFVTFQNPILSRANHLYQKLPQQYTLTCSYVDEKSEKDSYYESIEHIHKSKELKPILSLKDFIAQNPNGCIPISDVSKRGLQFDVKIKVARFLRQYPSIFEEFVGPKYNLPWFRLTEEAAAINREENKVLEEYKEDLKERLKKFILMSKEKVLPFKIIKGMLWYLGLPEDFLQHQDKNFDSSFRVVELEDGSKGLGVESTKKILSVLQKNAMRKGLYYGEPMEAIEFPLFPSKGLRLRRKIQDWLKEFQKLPYVSPYEDNSHLDPNSDIGEKRVVGLLHEFLSLFVEHSVERKKLLCLKKYFELPQKVHKAFERHPHMFYLSFRNKTCTTILKEAYGDDELAMERHPMAMIRKEYIKLMKESEVILKRRRANNPFLEYKKLDFEMDSVNEVRREEEKQ